MRKHLNNVEVEDAVLAYSALADAAAHPIQHQNTTTPPSNASASSGNTGSSGEVEGGAVEARKPGRTREAANVLAQQLQEPLEGLQQRLDAHKDAMDAQARIDGQLGLRWFE